MLATPGMMQNNKVIIGITGGIGSGKSTVCHILAQMGGLILDCDALAHSVILKGTPGFTQVCDAIEGDYLDKATGEIDRKKLGALVFSNSELLSELEKITHYYVIKQVNDTIQCAMKDPAVRFIIIEAIRLIEAGIHKIADEVWLVTANRKTRLERVISRDSTTRELAQLRIKSQLEDEALCQYASRIIQNDRLLADLQKDIEFNLLDCMAKKGAMI